jgi:hypothetical protein
VIIFRDGLMAQYYVSIDQQRVREKRTQAIRSLLARVGTVQPFALLESVRHLLSHLQWYHQCYISVSVLWRIGRVSVIDDGLYTSARYGRRR